MIVKRDARERWAEVLAAIVEVPPAPGGADGMARHPRDWRRP